MRDVAQSLTQSLLATSLYIYLQLLSQPLLYLQRLSTYQNSQNLTWVGSRMADGWFGEKERP